MKVSRKVQLSYNMGHTRLKNLSETGAKLLILVPGAGLEPARTLPSPRDFKSRVSTNSTTRAYSEINNLPIQRRELLFCVKRWVNNLTASFT
jgi:hypothetical protein